MTEWQSDFPGSFYSYLPKGCQICRMGAGMVLFITGLCTRSCFYCPISSTRKNIDAIFANERPVEMMDEILDEASSIGALGTGITGGEALLKLGLVKECIRALKTEFGQQHHIHLYTGQIPDLETLNELQNAGLDEIRIHPANWSDQAGLKVALLQAMSIGMDAGVEIPAISPAPKIVEVIKNTGAFLNLNELEFSETNQMALEELGFLPQENHSGAIGSAEIAWEHFRKSNLKVHFCPSRFKDAVQLRERLKRRAERVARPFDHLTEDGTLIYGIIAGNSCKAISILRGLDVPEEMYALVGDGIEIAPHILEEISIELKCVGLDISIIERYPMKDGLIVERIPL